MQLRASIFIAFCHLFFLANTTAQIRFSGFIYSTDSMPLPNATILLHSLDKDSKPLIGFTNSDNRGYYSLEIAEENSIVSLTVRTNSFQEVKKEIQFTSAIQIIQENFFLMKSVSYLDTVKIDLKFSISKTGDTITFNPDAYSLKNETNIEQLLQRLPGMDVSQDGRITFNGKPVGSVLIDGDDLFKRNYQQLTQSASPHIIDKIEVIKNFQKDQLLKEFSQAGTQVINLKLKKKYKNYLFGNMDAGYGNKDNELADIFLIKLSPRAKIQAGGNYNTIGNTYAINGLFNISDYLDIDERFFSYPAGTSVLRMNSYYFPHIPSYYQQKNKSVQGAGNALFKKNNWESLFNAKLASDELKQDQRTTSVYTDGTKLFTDNTGIIEKAANEFTYSVSRTGKSESMYVNAFIKNKKKNDRFNTTSGHSPETNQNLKENDLVYSLDFSHYKKLKEGALWKNMLGYFKQTIDGDLKTSPDFLFWLFPEDLNLYNLKSSAKKEIEFIKAKTGVSVTKGRMKNELDLLFTSENRTFKSNLHTIQIPDKITAEAFQNSSDFHNNYVSFLYNGSVQLTRKYRLTFSGSNEPHFFKYDADTLKVPFKFFYDYSVGISSKLRNSRMNLSMGLGRTYAENELIFPSFIQTSYHNLQSGYLDLNGVKSTYIQGSYDMMSVKLGLMSFLHVKYSHNKNDFIQNLNTSGLGTIYSYSYYSHNSGQLIAFFNAQKTLGKLPFHLKANGNYVRISLYNGFNGKINRMNMENLKATLELKTHLKSVFNADYGFTVVSTRNTGVNANSMTPATNTLLHKLKLYFTFNKTTNASVTLNTMNNKKVNYKGAFLDAAISKKFWKEKFQAQVNGRNLFNEREIRNQVVSSFSIQDNIVMIRGAEFFLKLKYEIR